MRVPHTFRRRLGECKRLLCAFDFDGTLSEIAPTPGQAAVSRGMREMLVRLEGLADVVIVSSRRAGELRKKLPFLRRAGFYGMHGLETPHGKLKVPRGRLAAVESAKAEAARLIAPFKGAWIEGKDSGFSVHFRDVAPARQEPLAEALMRKMKSRRLLVYRGRKAVEVLARGSPTKASTLHSISRRLPQGTLMLFFGDDEADEAAFQALAREKNFVGVAVGRKKTSAGLTVINPRGVEEFLRYINNLLSLTNPAGGPPV
ncbi:MAG: trehalose-phosphatase [Candidatus Micrarchaeota archaeon]